MNSKSKLLLLLSLLVCGLTVGRGKILTRFPFAFRHYAIYNQYYILNNCYSRALLATMASFGLIVVGELVGTGLVVDVEPNWVLARVNAVIASEIKRTYTGLAANLPALELSTSADGERLDGSKTLASYSINESTPVYVRPAPIAGAYSHLLAAIFAFSRLND